MLFQSERLNFRVMTVDDAPLMLEVLNTPEFLQFVGDRNLHTLEATQTRIQEHLLPQQDRLGYSMYHVSLRETGEPVGMCGLIRRDGLDDTDVGYAFRPAHYGKGYATEAVRAVLEYARRTLGMRRVVAIVDPSHAASIHVLNKAGLSKVGMVCLPGETEAINLLAIDLE